MTAPKDKQFPPIPVRNLDPGIYSRARAAARLLKQSIGEWITQAVEDRLNKEKGESNEN